MKVVACENCGAKYQIDDNEQVDDYECSVCAGNLNSVEEYPSKHSLKKQNHSNLYRDDFDSKIVYCKDCGLKYTLKSNENLKDYECSSCYGDLRYIDEKLNETIDEPPNNLDKLEESKNHRKEQIDEEKYRDDLEDVIYVEKPFYGSNTLNNKNEIEDSNEYQFNSQESYKKDTAYKNNGTYKDNGLNNNKYKNEAYKKDIDDINNSNIVSNPKHNNAPNFDSNIIYPMTETNLRKLEKKLRNEIKKDFSESISKSYGKTLERNIDINQSLYNENKNNVSINTYNYKNENKTIDDNTKDNLEEKKSKESEESIFDKISKRNTEEEKKKGSITDKTPNQKQELIPHPNTKNTSYHDVYIIAGLIIALIGLLDVLLSKRIYSVIFIVIGIIIFIIGLIKNNNYVSTEKRGRLIREKLLTLPDNFYVLYYVRVPDSNEGINHVVVGSSGIFSIVSQSYNEKEDKNKTKTENENKNLVNKSNLDDLTLLDESENIDVTNNINSNTNNKSMNKSNNKSNNKINNKNRDNKNKNNKNVEYDEYNNNENNNTIKNVTESNIKENNQKRPNRFKFKEAENKFPHNNKIKQKSIHLSEELIDFLNESGFQNFYVEPLVGFVNNEVAVINMPLTDEDLFIDELLQKIVHGKRQLDDKTTHRVAVLLSQYATECSS